MKNLRVAIIGQGRSGRNIHGKYLLTDPDRFTVTAVVDAIPGRRERARQEYGCEAYEDYTGLFKGDDIDFVINASYSHQHEPITLDLLRHGFNVLVEKPAAGSPEELQAMAGEADARGRMLAIFQQSRFAPYFEKVREVIESGALGRIVQFSVRFSGFQRRWDWQCSRSRNGGSLRNTGPHPLDQALCLMGFPENPGVFCRMDRANTFGDAEDWVKLIMTAPGRPLADIEISSCDAFPSFTYQVQGTNGGLSGSMTEIHWRYFKPEEAPARELILESLSDAEGLPVYCSEQLSWTEGSWESQEDGAFTYAVRRLYDTVYDRLVNGAPLVVTPEQVKLQLEVIRECQRQNPRIYHG